MARQAAELANARIEAWARGEKQDLGIHVAPVVAGEQVPPPVKRAANDIKRDFSDALGGGDRARLARDVDAALDDYIRSHPAPGPATATPAVIATPVVTVAPARPSNGIGALGALGRAVGDAVPGEPTAPPR